MLLMHHSYCIGIHLALLCFRSVLVVGYKSHIVLIFLSGQSDHYFHIFTLLMPSCPYSITQRKEPPLPHFHTHPKKKNQKRLRDMFNADLETMMDDPNYQWPRIVFFFPFFSAFRSIFSIQIRKLNQHHHICLSFDYLQCVIKDIYFSFQD